MTTAWNLIARLCARPWARQRIINLAQSTPYFDIVTDGKLYMRRWWLMPRWCLDFDMVRGYPMPKAWMPFSIRVHHIVRPDPDRHLHDHPFNFRSIVLDGWYVEERPFTQLTDREALRIDGLVEDEDGTRALTTITAGSTYSAQATRWHRISRLSDGGAWSLFIMGRRINGWGFLVNGKKVPWREYLEGRE